MTENERVKELRKARGMTLEQFGARIGIGKSAISDIENGRRPLTKQNRLSICREFNIREEWLRDGDGNMTAENGTFSIDDLVKQAGLTGQEADTVKKLVQVFCSLKTDTRKELLSKFDEYFGTVSTPEQRARARANEYYEEALAEEKAVDSSSASQPTGAQGA